MELEKIIRYVKRKGAIENTLLARANLVPVEYRLLHLRESVADPQVLATPPDISCYTPSRTCSASPAHNIPPNTQPPIQICSFLPASPKKSPHPFSISQAGYEAPGSLWIGNASDWTRTPFRSASDSQSLIQCSTSRLTDDLSCEPISTLRPTIFGQAQLCKLPFSLFKDIGHDPHSISTQLVMRPPRLGRMILIGRTSQTGLGPQQLQPSCLKRESQPRREDISIAPGSQCAHCRNG